MVRPPAQRRRAAAYGALAMALAAAGCARAPAPPPPAPSQAEERPTITRDALFRAPARASVTLSPGGELIAFLAPRGGAPNLFVVPTASLGVAYPVTSVVGAGVVDYIWTGDGAHLVYALEGPGEERRLTALNILTGEQRVLTQSGRAEILAASAGDPTAVLVSMDTAMNGAAQIYRIDTATGARSRVDANRQGFFRFYADLEGRVRLGMRVRPDGQVELWTKDPGAAWRLLFTLAPEDALNSAVVTFEADGQTFLMLDSAGRDRAALVRVDASTGAKTVLGESARADVAAVWTDPRTGAPQAYGADYLRSDWRALNDAAQADLTYLAEAMDGDVRVVSRSRDDRLWIVTEEGPTIAPQSYLFSRGENGERQTTLLFRHYPDLARASLQPMTPVEIEARDGLTLVSYLTLPAGADADGDSLPDRPLPLVILAPQGLWPRESYGFNPLHQWLANRGYAVLSVNVRGARGFGRGFLAAGTHALGGATQDDLADAARWAFERGVAQGDRIALFGEGFGGYAAAMGVARTPERFACAVARSAPLDLESAFTGLEARQAWRRPLLSLRIANPGTEEGRALLRERSFNPRASGLARPLFIATGGRDASAPRSALDALAQSARARRAGLVAVVYPDEGARFAHEQARLSFLAVSENFLRSCLGGQAEPLSDVFEGVRAQSLAGARRVAGLLRSAPPPPEAPPAPLSPPPPVLLEATPLASP